MNRGRLASCRNYFDWTMRVLLFVVAAQAGAVL
jgi:hypothetical protein